MEFRTGGFVPLEANVDGTILAFDFELTLAIAEPQSALAFARDDLTIKLPRYAALALAQNVVNCGCYSGQYFTRLTLGCLRVKSPAKFFGNETGGEFSGLPAGMRHQRRQERDIMAGAVGAKSIEGGSLRCYSRPPCRRVRPPLSNPPSPAKQQLC